MIQRILKVFGEFVQQRRKKIRETLALTPALSPRRGSSWWAASGLRAVPKAKDRQNLLMTDEASPSLGGEGRGEGESNSGLINALASTAEYTQQPIRNTVIASLDRRDFLKFAFAATGLAALGGAEAAQTPRDSTGLIDVNVNLSRWPLRRLRFDDTPAVVAKLRNHGVAQAWAGSFDGLLHKDIAAVNARLADECRRHGRGVLIAFGSINPKLPDWEEELQRCAEQHRMPGIRLHPNYHGYKLDDPLFARLLRLATERRLIVQLALIMEDERMMHPLLRVEPVDTAPLADVVKQKPGLRLVLLNALGKLHGKPLSDLLAAGEVYVEISMLEGVGGLGNLLTLWSNDAHASPEGVRDSTGRAQVPANRVLFGSHAPLFYFESSLLKLKESLLSKEELNSIQSTNARRLMTSQRS